MNLTAPSPPTPSCHSTSSRGQSPSSAPSTLTSPTSSRSSISPQGTSGSMSTWTRPLASGRLAMLSKLDYPALRPTALLVLTWSPPLKSGVAAPPLISPARFYFLFTSFFFFFFFSPFFPCQTRRSCDLTFSFAPPPFRS